MAKPTTTTRRSTLLGALGLSTAAVPAVAGGLPPLPIFTAPGATPVSPDAELIRLCDLMVAGGVEQNVLLEPSFCYRNYKWPEGAQERVDELSEQYCDLRVQVADMKATTLDGYRAKARALMLQHAPGGEGDEPGPACDEYLSWSLCRDLLA